jgi:glycosyltransferase involved in cell wall biosynthesis
MITVVIPTLDSERRLVPTLSALVRGATEGLVREVLLADAGSRDGTRAIAEAAGCEMVHGPVDEGSRLAAAMEIARSEWLMIVDPGAILDDVWTREVRLFLAGNDASTERVAAFRMAIDAEGATHRVRERLAAARVAILGRPRPEEGLLIAKRFYQSLGGFFPGREARGDLLRRITRKRFTILRTRISLPAR